jgi:hypothetical protein
MPLERMIPRGGIPGRKCQQQQESAMYLARFSYDVTPVNRQRAIDFILREVSQGRPSSGAQCSASGAVDSKPQRRGPAVRA